MEAAKRKNETEWKWNWFSFCFLLLCICMYSYVFCCWKWKGFTSQIKWIILRFPYPRNLISFSITTKPRNRKKIHINTKLFFFCYLRNSTYLPTKSMFIALLPPEPANVLIDGKYGTGYNKYPFVKGKVYNEIQYMHTHTHRSHSPYKLLSHKHSYRFPLFN